ncbi:Rhodanese-like domain-containing protein [Mycena alexandri]|uniref:Rhodanese-like domain-containing protein n=1 Tax=Mycena alexandri TaxID=1745969 RepID=A0AAD6TBU3_9AGAR|nr:Rhodanese-like domain-containing protein [Mycena alexandri]
MLLSPTRLSQLLRTDAARTIILDVSWFMPNSPRIAKKRISSTAHMLPSREVFAKACEKFGIEPSSRVVMYDSHGVFSSPRALWTFKCFGHQNAAILDGGLPRWAAEGFPIETKSPQDSTIKAKYPVPSLESKAVRSYEEVVSNSGLIPFQSPKAELVLDARSRGRYLGTDPEPRPGLSSGHIPNSVSLPFNLFLENNVAKDGSAYTTFLSEPQLRAAVVDALGLEKAQLVFDGKVSVIASCGSGMSAAILWLGLQSLGVKQVAIYDESWTGYALRPSSRIEKSP